MQLCNGGEANAAGASAAALAQQQADCFDVLTNTTSVNFQQAALCNADSSWIKTV
jgi:hypothetical protein